MHANKYLVFDIQRFSIHDGPGIRTTIFLKGCPLACQWCQNPEGIGYKREILYDEQKCIGCYECVRACSHGVLSIQSGHLELARDQCVMCGACTDNCYSGALRFSVMYMTKDQIIDEILLDREFYKLTGGGVTFSGGEPLSHIALLDELIQECKKRNINTAVETSLYVDFEKLTPLLNNIDHFMVDLKVYDNDLHKEYTGVSNKKILENIKKLTDLHESVVIRTPIIPGVNDNKQEISQIQTFIEDLKSIQYWELLPYHRFGEIKYKQLGLKAKSFENSEMDIRKLVDQKSVPVKY